MTAEIITIGDEILIGQTIDTNSAWLGQKLNALGVDVNRITSIHDEEGEIIKALDEAAGRSDLILMTGGLGPTRDDITKNTLAKYFDDHLVIVPEVLEGIEEYFTSTGRPMLEVNRQQAALPSRCRVIINHRGTASGMWFERNGKVFVSMPGVPYEMKGLMEDEILALIQQRFPGSPILHRTIMTQGVGESFLADLIADWETQLRLDGLTLAYLPSPGIVKLRITAKGFEEQHAGRLIDEKLTQFMELAGRFVFGFDDQPLEYVVGELLRKRGKHLAIAESCTGGAIGARMVSIAGSSDYFLGGAVAYSYGMKEDMLEVSHEDLVTHGAVSGIIAEQMAVGMRKKSGADFAIATTGIAGPGGGTPDKPVGTVWIAVASAAGVKSRCFRFRQNRSRNIELTAHSALFMLYREIIDTDV